MNNVSTNAYDSLLSTVSAATSQLAPWTSSEFHIDEVINFVCFSFLTSDDQYMFYACKLKERAL